jgi:two-component system, chemotaxis family, chemotaxis protein CheY
MDKIQLNILFLSQDDKMVLEMLAFSVEESLQDISIGVLETSTEEEAMKILEFNNIDLIIADMNIDSLASYQFYDKLQALHKFNHIPFVFLSSDIEDQEIAVLKGVQNFFLKPLNIDQLLEHVSTILKKQKNKYKKYILPLEGDYEREVQQQTLQEILDISNKIDLLIQNNAPLEQIRHENQKIATNVEKILASNLVINDTI